MGTTNTIKFSNRFNTILAAAIAAIFAFTALAVPIKASADVGVDVPANGGAITPGEKTDSIRMKKETVVFKVKQGTGPFADAYKNDESSESSRFYAHVTATFTMQNLTKESVSQNMVFPFHLRMEEENWSLYQAKNSKVTVDGKEVNVTYDNNTPFGENPAAAGHFNATFLPSSDTKIVVEYDLRAISKPKSPQLALDYMMQTGSHWAGTIGEGDIIVDFENQDLDSPSPVGLDSRFKPKNGNLVWHFENLEPTKQDDIDIAFDPYILNTVWPKRQSFIYMLSASTSYSNTVICGNTRTQSSDCMSIMDKGQELGVGYGNTNLAVLNVLTAPGITDANGWLVQSDVQDKWLDFTFDGNYTFSGIQIRGGYLDTNPDYSKGYTEKPGSFYDSFQRPKTVEVTYSDGTKETLTFADKPTELQTVALKNSSKATGKIRLTFTDSYAGMPNGNKYFGVGRVMFAGAKKASSSDQKDTKSQAETTAEPKKKKLGWQMYAAAAAAAVVIVGGLAVFAVRINRAHRIGQNGPKTPKGMSGQKSGEPEESENPKHEEPGPDQPDAKDQEEPEELDQDETPEDNEPEEPEDQEEPESEEEPEDPKEEPKEPKSKHKVKKRK